jgi:hypothetical protein
MSEGVLGLQKCLDDILLITSSGIQLIDARDLALAHVTILERGGPPDRYVMGGQFFGWTEFADLLEELLGKSLRRVHAPRLLLLGLGQWVDLVSRFIPIEAPITYEALTYASEWKIADDSKARRELGVQYRDIRETLTDTILWLHDSGNLRRKELAANLLRARDGLGRADLRQNDDRTSRDVRAQFVLPLVADVDERRAVFLATVFNTPGQYHVIARVIGYTQSELDARYA